MPVLTSCRFSQPSPAGPMRGKYPESTDQHMKEISLRGQTMGGLPLTD